MNQDDHQNNLPRVDEPKMKPRIFPKIFWTFLIVFFIVFALLFAKAYNLGNKVFVGNGSFFSRIAGIFTHQALQGEDTNQVNILLLGYGGEGHDGPYLTDSMILATINPKTKQVVLTSIPRDYYWPDSPYTAKKINAAFADGVGKDLNYQRGGEEATRVVGELTGLNIPYFASIDFSGFKQAVDRVGGLDIHIDETFTDYQYPNDSNYGYLPPITFKAGDEHMNGERALEFVRSRHAEGPEGSDFARSKRQAKVLDAFKNKVQSLNIVTNSNTLNDLLNIFANHFHTNMEPGEILRLKDVLNSPDTKVTGLSLDPDTGLVCNKLLPPDNQFVIIPCDSVSFTNAQIQDYFANSTDYVAMKDEHATIIIENAGNTVLFNELKQELAGFGATVYEVPYRGLPISKSVLYKTNSKPATEKFISSKIGSEAQPKPDSINASSDLVLFVAGD